MARILLVMDGPLFRADARMGGLQVRTYEMARALARKGHQVSVVAPGSLRCPWGQPGFEIHDSPWLLAGRAADVWIAHPFVATRYAKHFLGIPLVVDGYEFPFGSFLNNGAAMLPALGERIMDDYRNTVTRILRALRLADRLLCANENQRISYLTLLCALGKINPKYSDNELVLQVCSGGPPEVPTADLRRCPVLAQIRRKGPVVLWAGGCYPWFDIETYFRSMPEVLRRVPDVQFVFAGLEGMTSTDEGSPQYKGTKQLINFLRGSRELEARSTFVDWLPYCDRGLAYAASDVGVCTHGAHLETSFSMRTRVLDMIWGGLPVVSTGGDAVSQRLVTWGAGLSVSPGASDSLADALVTVLLDGDLRRRMRSAALALAQGEFSWDSQVEPLHRYCLNPVSEPSARDRLVRATAGQMMQIGDGLDWRVRHFFRRAHRRAQRLFNASSAKGGDSGRFSRQDKDDTEVAISCPGLIP